MTSVTENDFKRLEDLIISRFTAMEHRFTAIEDSIGEIKTDIRDLRVEVRETQKDVRTLQTEVRDIQTDVRSLQVEQGKLAGKMEGFTDRLRAIEGTVGTIPALAERMGELKNWRSVGFAAPPAIAFLILGAAAGWIAKNSLGNNP